MPNSRTILHVCSSPRGQFSNSYQLGRRLTQSLCANGLADEVTERYLGGLLPPMSDSIFAAEQGPAAAQRMRTEQSDVLIDELERACLLVISTPIHNFTVPTVLKAWIDQIVRLGRTFENTPAGMCGLLASKPVFALVTSGGPVGNGFVDQRDFLTPYLSYLLRSIGLTDMRCLRLDGMSRSAADAQAALDVGYTWIEQQVAGLCRSCV